MAESVDDRLARVAYDAYCDAVGGVSAVTGDQLPPFADTPVKVQQGWHASAQAVREHVLTLVGVNALPLTKGDS